MSGKSDKQPAQVMTNLMSIPLYVYANPNTFYTLHEGFTSTEVIFTRNMHLLYMNSKEAAFTEVDKTIDIMNVRKYPLFFIAQNRHTTRIIVLPLTIFEEAINYMDDECDNQRQVVWFFHSTRCGSTAWAQVFNALPGWTVYSEPQIMHYTSVYGDHGCKSIQEFSQTPAFDRYVTLMIKYNLINMPKGNNVFWKGTVLDEYMIPIIAKRFPKHKILFGYRDILPNALSFTKLVARFPAALVALRCTLGMAEQCENKKVSISRIINTNFTSGLSRENCHKVYTQVKLQNAFERVIFMLAARLSVVRNFATESTVRFVKYESLLSNQRAAISDLFHYLDVSVDLVDIAADALQCDSQAGLSIPRTDEVLPRRTWSRTDDSVQRCNIILRLFNLPEIDSPLVM